MRKYNNRPHSVLEEVKNKMYNHISSVTVEKVTTA